MGDTYPPHPRAKVNRYRTRATYDYSFIHSVVNTARVVHVSFPPAGDDPFPALLPMIGCMALYDASNADAYPDADPEDQALDIYLHGYVSSRIMRQSGDGNALPVTVAATHIDGLVMSLTPNSHSYNYRSAVLFGHATPVTDEKEKLWAMRRVTNSVMPGRWEHTRTPPTPTEMRTTAILRVRVASASGKQRRGEPHDDRADVEDEEMRKGVWTGVLPVVEHIGAPVPLGEGLVQGVPDYIAQGVREMNERAEQSAREGMQEPEK